MSNPSFLNVPYRFKAGTLYSQIPESGLGDLVVTRTTTPTANRSTRVNAQGFIETVADNVPRLDYPIGGIAAGCPALLVEPSAANAILNSANITTGWTLGADLSSTAESFIGLSGRNLTVVNSTGIGLNARLFTQPSPGIPLVSGTTYTISFFMKKTGTHTIGGYAAFSTIGDFGGGFNVASPFTTGQVYSSVNIINRVRKIEQWGPDIFRCSETFTANANGNIPFLAFGPLNAVNNQASPAAGLGIAFAAPQFETGSIATSYIPTTTAPITRGAEVVNKTGVSSLIGQTEGTIYVELDMRNFVTNAMACFVSDGTGFNSISVQIFAPPNSIRVGISRLGVGQIDFIVPMPSGVNKVALGYAQNNVAIYLNGTSVATSAVCLIPATSRVDLGSRIGTGSYLNDRIRSLAIYPTRLTNAQLQALTT